VDAQGEADRWPEQSLRRRFDLPPRAFDAHAFRDSRACQEGQREPPAEALTSRQPRLQSLPAPCHDAGTQPLKFIQEGDDHERE
jgi:hypothetical protein